MSDMDTFMAILLHDSLISTSKFSFLNTFSVPPHLPFLYFYIIVTF